MITSDIRFKLVRRLAWYRRRVLVNSRILKMGFLWSLFKLDISITKRVERNVVISVTSYPARFCFLARTLRTLITQTVRPDSIRVYIEEKDIGSLGNDLKGLAQYGVEFCPTASGWRAATKLIPELLREDARQDLILYLDDEIVYDCRLVENLLFSMEKNQESDVIFNWGDIVPKWSTEEDCLPAYKTWLTTDRDKSSHKYIIPLGVAGVLIKRHSIPLEVTNFEQFSRVSSSNDDLWFWCHFVQKDLRLSKSFRFSEPPIYWKGSQEQALWKTNAVQGENDVIMKRLIEEFPKLRELIESNKG